uniref:Uncharacterized protein n=1 Tax=Myoviridae sp. cted82 TaxID=2827696 RepID=A0A8S5TNS3_9CAUD|nr:MAG TPA: hypothetical protein [Myoviridae sp. cted82]
MEDRHIIRPITYILIAKRLLLQIHVLALYLSCNIWRFTMI